MDDLMSEDLMNFFEENAGSEQFEHLQPGQDLVQSHGFHPTQEGALNAFGEVQNAQSTYFQQCSHYPPREFAMEPAQQGEIYQFGALGSTEGDDPQTIAEAQYEESKKRKRATYEDEIEVKTEEGSVSDEAESAKKRRKNVVSRSRADDTELIPGKKRRFRLNSDGTRKFDKNGEVVTARGSGKYTTKRMRRHEYLLWSLNWFGNNPHPVTKDHLARECIAATRPFLKARELLDENNKKDRSLVVNLIHVHEKNDAILFMGGRTPAANPLDERSRLKRDFRPAGKLAPWGTWKPGDPIARQARGMILPPQDIAAYAASDASGSFQGLSGSAGNELNFPSGSSAQKKRKSEDENEDIPFKRKASAPSARGTFETYAHGDPSTGPRPLSNVGYYNYGATAVEASLYNGPTLPTSPTAPTEGVPTRELYTLHDVENAAILSGDPQFDENQAHMVAYEPAADIEPVESSQIPEAAGTVDDIDDLTAHVFDDNQTYDFPDFIAVPDFGAIYLPPSHLMGEPNESRFHGGNNTIANALNPFAGSTARLDTNNAGGIQGGGDDVQDQAVPINDNVSDSDSDEMTTEERHNWIEKLSIDELEYWMARLKHQLMLKRANADPPQPHP